jgi:cell filamentation protein
VSDPYLIPGTDVLRNKFNILDVDELDRRINDVAIAEAAVLFYAGPPVKPSMAGWQTVHKAMFGAFRPPTKPGADRKRNGRL